MVQPPPQPVRPQVSADLSILNVRGLSFGPPPAVCQYLKP
jgi:hypothetical protein